MIYIGMAMGFPMYQFHLSKRMIYFPITLATFFIGERIAKNKALKTLKEHDLD
jgi:hypothetical protein